MKKFLKFLLGVGAAFAVIGGILYFLKNVLMKDYLEDYDDDDFDNDLYEEDENEDRDYVTINVPEGETQTAQEAPDNNTGETMEDDLSAFDTEL